MLRGGGFESPRPPLRRGGRAFLLRDGLTPYVRRECHRTKLMYVVSAPQGTRGSRPMFDWQPIQTAPKDGTVVLVWSEGDYHLASYIDGPVPGWLQKDACFVLSGHMEPPTHWRPLPLPPQRQHKATIRQVRTPAL